MQPILNLFDAHRAETDAISRMAFAVLKWSSTTPAVPGLYGWVCGSEGPEIVTVRSIDHGELTVQFSRPLTMVEVQAHYPDSRWAKINRGGQHESA